VVVRWLDPRGTLVEHDGADTLHGARILDAFLAARFHAIARYGVYQVLVRTT
jgi:methylaspartate ammonia-lyase